MLTIIFESHSTTEDNESKLAAGWFDTPLSELGKKQAKQLGERYKDTKLDAIFCSDLSRSYNCQPPTFCNTLSKLFGCFVSDCVRSLSRAA
jgi:bisphosphoglycerate-dependent phosphoglycerate mutase